MAAVARHLEWRRLPGAAIVRLALLDGAMPRRATSPDGRAPSLRIAAIGVASLVGLPILLIASLILEAPLAAPAAIALGHVAAARATARGETRKATGWSLAVLIGLLCWTLAFFAGSDSLSASELAAVLSAPILAVAPLPIASIGRRDGAAARRVRADIACLEALAPGEALLFVDADATILTGTHAGFAALRLPSSAEGTAIADAVSVVDRPPLLNAVAMCAKGGGPTELTVRLADGDPSGAPGVALSLASSREGGLTVRVRAAAGGVPQIERVDAGPAAAISHDDLPRPACHLAAAVGFAIRKVGRKAQSHGVTLIRREADDLRAACDAALCQRILALAIETAIVCSAPGSAVGISARRVRGAALVRIGCATDDDASASAHRLDERIGRMSLRELIDAAGGTLLVEVRDGAAAMSIRLGLAREAAIDVEPNARRGAA